MEAGQTGFLLVDEECVGMDFTSAHLKKVPGRFSGVALGHRPTSHARTHLPPTFKLIAPSEVEVRNSPWQVLDVS